MPKYYYSIECEAVPFGKDQIYPPIGVWVADNEKLISGYIQGKETRDVLKFYIEQHPEYSPVDKLYWLASRLSVYVGMVSSPVEIEGDSVEAVTKILLEKIVAENQRITGGASNANAK
jgi:hypothetical protein